MPLKTFYLTLSRKYIWNNKFLRIDHISIVWPLPKKQCLFVLIWGNINSVLMMMCAKFYRSRTFNFKVIIKKPISEEKIGFRSDMSERNPKFFIWNWFFDHNLKIKCSIPINFAYIIMRTLLMFPQINTNKQCYLGSGHTILMWSTRKIVLFQMYFLDNVK